jgi:parvulin-like peptidyl-prolyl isomerase
MYASHIFLAAPPETVPEIVESKRTTLAAETSEDEATKLNGGDLGFSSTNRMPPILSRRWRSSSR